MAKKLKVEKTKSGLVRGAERLLDEIEPLVATLERVVAMMMKADMFRVGQKVKLSPYAISSNFKPYKGKTTGVVTQNKGTGPLWMRVRRDGQKKDSSYLCGFWMPVNIKSPIKFLNSVGVKQK